MHSLIKHNMLARFLFNRFDFIIRILYCKLRCYRLFDYLLPDLYSSNFASLNSYFSMISDALRKNGFRIEDKSVLEIGPGNSYINAYNFLHAGARRVILVDKFPRYTDSDRQRSYIKNEIEFFKSRSNTREFPYIDQETGALNPNFIAFIAGDLRSIVFENNVDFIYSIAVLHHVQNLEQYIRRMSEILNPGGMMYHVVDLKDKFHSFGNPFLFYKYSDFTWEKFCTDSAVTYTNRVRYRDYMDMFERSGFDLVWEKTLSYDFPRFRINKKFAGRTDLSIGDAHFLLRKR
ncbi:MAG: class I SAM-dependent methyltransferase [Spirochaetes bacterium]|nr:class I SAM-dependent methyltransferase [Spirochaetota bacterium]